MNEFELHRLVDDLLGQVETDHFRDQDEYEDADRGERDI